MQHFGTKVIETNNLVLRPFKEEDAKEIYNGFRNQEKFLYYAHKEKITLKEQIKSLKGIDKKYKNKEYYNWLITLKDNTVIGAIHLNVFNYNESVEFNYAIDERYQNKGYMTEALLIIKDFCLNKMQVNRFFGGCEINNLPSKKVMEKCGLIHEGILRNNLLLRDGYHDMDIYSFINNRD